MPAHVHAELMKQYAEDAMTTDKPWELWQSMDEDGDWFDLSKPLAFFSNLVYRRKPRTIKIGSHEVPEPMRVEPKIGQEFWMPDLTSPFFSVICRGWAGYTDEKMWLQRGIIHLSKEACEAHARALLSFTEVKE